MVGHVGGEAPVIDMTYWSLFGPRTWNYCYILTQVAIFIWAAADLCVRGIIAAVLMLKIMNNRNTLIWVWGIT